MNILRSFGQDALSELRNCNNLNAVNCALFKFALGIGVEFFQLIPGPANSLEDASFIFEVGNFPSTLKDFYKVETNRIKDPAFIIALEKSAPIKWRSVFLNCRIGQQRKFIGFLRENGLYDGFSVPIHGPNGCVAILLFASAKIIQKDFEDTESLCLVAVSLLQRIKRIMAAGLISNPNKAILTERESECLKWVLDGKTNWEIGVLVGISARTVQFHLANSARKLGVNNRIQAGIKALISGIINLPIQADENSEKNDIDSNIVMHDFSVNICSLATQNSRHKTHF